MRDIESYNQYTLYAAAVRGPAPTTAGLISTLDPQTPKSKYLEEAYGPYFLALNCCR